MQQIEIDWSAPPPPPPRSPDPMLGRAIGHASAQLAADAAEADDEGWSECALTFLRQFARERGSEPFLGEDVRHAAQERGAVPAPREPRAWGAVVLAAARRKWIRRVGYGIAQDPKSHGNPKSLWVWAGES